MDRARGWIRRGNGNICTRGRVLVSVLNVRGGEMSVEHFEMKALLYANADLIRGKII